jgi:hypothetical protein
MKKPVRETIRLGLGKPPPHNVHGRGYKTVGDLIAALQLLPQDYDISIEGHHEGKGGRFICTVGMLYVSHKEKYVWIQDDIDYNYDGVPEGQKTGFDRGKD